jgi:signal transduction histidine kinase
MTELAQSAKAAEPWLRGEVNGFAKPARQTGPGRREPYWLGVIGGWRGLGWLTCGIAGSLAIGWFIFFSPGESGSKSEWFFGSVVLGVVVVAMWQNTNIQRQAAQAAAEAAERLRNELVAAEQFAAEAAERLRQELASAEDRSERELTLTRSLHQAEMEARQTLHQTEMEAWQTLHRAQIEAQSELARAERAHLLKRLQKQSMIEVSRAVSANTQIMAALWNQAARVLRIADRDERELAMSPIFEQISQVVNDFSVELGNAHLVIDDDRLHQALNRVNEAAVMAVRVAEEVHAAVVEGHAPQPNPIPQVQRLMYTRAAEARRLAWDLLRSGLDDSVEGAQAG